jgi:hypothetical protein
MSDLDTTIYSANNEVFNAEQWKIMEDAQTTTFLLEQESNAYKMEVENQSNDAFDDALRGANAEGAAPQQMETNPDGREVMVYGNPTDYAEFCHQQGDNDLGFKEDCGLCSSQDVLNQFGVQVDENDVVHHAVDNNECYTDSGNAANSGQTTADYQAHILSDYGVPAHVENGGSLDDLAHNIENGSGVIAEVNAGVLWNDANSYEDGSANHAITVTAVVRDPESGQIQGFYVNDSGDGHAAKFVDAATMQSAWADTGGQSVVTDVTH